MNAQCTRTLTWTPFDAERGVSLAERTEACSLDAGHTGYHHGPGGAFGPYPAPSTPEQPEGGTR